ncbi:MAG: hypothetical protein M3552_08285 [Planctomycetota bacterium]|nr:hypothetical protein [Planctomycetaceae bacterium]MDQ3330637.1 hypothetical protein [Planctomycetota bacterium]
MINRIATVEAPGNGRRRVLPADPSAIPDRSSGADLNAQIKQFIGDHASLSLAIGLTIGIIVGCLIKRR